MKWRIVQMVVDYDVRLGACAPTLRHEKSAADRISPWQNFLEKVRRDSFRQGTALTAVLYQISQELLRVVYDPGRSRHVP